MDPNGCVSHADDPPSEVPECVVQTAEHPPFFIISPGFTGLTRVLADLNLPDDPKVVYYSYFRGGGDYVRAKGDSYQKSQHFTIEFLAVRPPSDSYISPSDQEPPIQYIDDSTYPRVHVRRVRVYETHLADLPKLGICPSQPMSPYSPPFPYLEQKWPLQRSRSVILLGGVDLFRIAFSDLQNFYERAYRILRRMPIQSGRPCGSGLFSDSWEFYKAVLRVHTTLWIESGKKPTQKEVAWRMNVELPTFKKYWSKTRCRWADIPPPEAYDEDYL